MRWTRAPRWLRTGKRAISRLAIGLAALIVLFGVLRGGGTYVFCPSMQMVSDTPCCSPDHDDEGDGRGEASLREGECCERHVLGKLPLTSAASDPTPSFAPPLLAIVSTAANMSDRHVERPRAAGPGRVRDGPAPWRGPSRAELMVYLN